MLEANGPAAIKHVCQGANPGDLGDNVRAAVQKTWQHTELPFKLKFLMSASLFIYKSWILGGIVPGLSSGLITKLGTQQSQLMLLYRWNKTDIQVDVDGFKWNLQKHRIPGFTAYI